MARLKRYFLQRYGAIGDVLMAEPLLRELTARGHRVTFVTSALGAQVLENFPDANLTISLNRNQFLRGYRKLTRQIKKLKYEKFPELPVQEAYAQIAGVEDFVPGVPRLYLTAEEEECRLPRPYVILHLEPHIGLNHRRVFGVSWESVVAFLKQRGYEVYQVGLEGVEGCGEHLETPNLRELARVIHGSSLFLGIDSAPAHFAVSLRKKSILFFGSVDPRLRHVDFQGIEIVQGPCEFAGCYHRGQHRATRDEVVCLKVGQDGIPPCCEHSTAEVIARIETLLSPPVDLAGP